ncbi:hypothetical protein, partial [Ornatilinea apprima]|uniref:hypothetical protein n=1 Tax=Ornatilinea apprima TaxID=1134406 RepID=UPI00128F0061
MAFYVIPARVCYQARYTPQPDIEIAREIAKRIGLESDSWFAIISYLYYDQPEIGATKDEVHQVLGLIGPWEITYSGEPKRINLDDRPISGEYQEIIQFSEEDLNRGLHKWVEAISKMVNSGSNPHEERADGPYRRTMESNQTAYTRTTETSR